MRSEVYFKTRRGKWANKQSTDSEFMRVSKLRWEKDYEDNEFLYLRKRIVK